MIELAAFKAKGNIDKDFELKKPQSDIDIHAVVDNLEAAWNEVQAVSYTNWRCNDSGSNCSSSKAKQCQLAKKKASTDIDKISK